MPFCCFCTAKTWHKQLPPFYKLRKPKKLKFANRGGREGERDLILNNSIHSQRIRHKMYSGHNCGQNVGVRFTKAEAGYLKTTLYRQCEPRFNFVFGVNPKIVGQNINFSKAPNQCFPFKVGINSLANRLTSINNKIPLSWLNLSLDTFKIRCKDAFIKF